MRTHSIIKSQYVDELALRPGDLVVFKDERIRGDMAAVFIRTYPMISTLYNASFLFYSPDGFITVAGCVRAEHING